MLDFMLGAVSGAAMLVVVTLVAFWVDERWQATKQDWVEKGYEAGQQDTAAEWYQSDLARDRREEQRVSDAIHQALLDGRDEGYMQGAAVGRDEAKEKLDELILACNSLEDANDSLTKDVARLEKEARAHAENHNCEHVYW